MKPDQARYVHIYCDSIAQKKRWEALAKSHGVSLSNFLKNKIEDALNPSNAIDSHELISLREENRYLQEELDMSENLIERANIMMQNQLALAKRLLDKQLIDTFRRHGKLSEEQLAEFGDGVTEQLEVLEKSGLIFKTRNKTGYQWHAEVM